MLTIKILGAGCSNCERLYEVARRAVEGLGADAQVVKITDFAEMVHYGILQTPGLVMNEKLLMSGKVPSERDMTDLIRSALSEAEG